MYIYGIHPVINFLKYRSEIIKNIYCTKDVYNKFLINYVFKQIKIISDKEISQKTGITDHQGIVAKISHFPYVEPESILETVQSICILDHIEDPRNLGAILRNALAFNIQLVVLPKNRACEVTGTVIKASAGAAAIVPVGRVNNINAFIRTLKEKYFWIYGFEGSGKECLSKTTFDKKSVLIFGSEGFGMHELTKRLCDFIIKIDMNDKASSLNVSAAAAIVFYKLYTQNNVA